MTIRAVFFDMGGTIETYHYTRPLRLQATSGLQELLLRGGIDLGLPDEQLLEVVTRGLESYKGWSKESEIELSPNQVWSEYILAGRPVNRERLAKIAESLTFYLETHYYQRQMRPEMPQVLESIRQMGLKIGVISNVSSRGQVPANLSAYGIRHYFDPLVLSSEYGRRKPDPAIFHYAARLASVPASACAYIGDRLNRDIEGARRAGFGLAIQIHHEFDQGEDVDGYAPDFMLEDMTALPEILRSANLARPDAPRTGQVRGLIFDAGDILYHRPERGRKFQAFLNELGLELDDNHAANKKVYEDQAYRGLISQEQYWQAVLGMYGITAPDLVARGAKILEEDDYNVRFFEGVRETLICLKEQGFLLGIITDTTNSVHAKLRWFERGGFGHVWDSIISSQELGTRKPDPRIYQAALLQLGITAEQAAFVGHKAYELEGARGVGMKTVAFNYEDAATADYYLEHFSDLLAIPLVLATQPAS